MRPTIRLGTVSGIAIGLHWSIAAIGFVLISALTGTVLPGLVPGLTGAAYFMAALATAVLFLGSIIAHELGHSIVAQRNGIAVRGITLFALGGVASLEREPDDPGAAARIALAGPAVSVAIGVVALVVSNLMVSLGFGALTTAAFFWLGLINLALAVFNMIPALPLDGGRVLQAVLWKRTGERHQATISAAKLGRWLGWAIVAFGVWQFTQSGTGLWTALIGWFVVMSAKAESLRARWAIRREQAQEAGDGGAEWPFAHLYSPPRGRPSSGPDFDSDLRRRRPSPSAAADPEVIDVTGRPASDDPAGRSVDKPPVDRSPVG
ncbi:MAG: site-2 protease family protein [Acidimicrobiia bacterium]|nr:site-2 protease family protein [Acidimicrobiia bacterium]MDH5521199.1 site-2 protease family protein [Acidimicrobiia bacterium]